MSFSLCQHLDNAINIVLKKKEYFIRKRKHFKLELLDCQFCVLQRCLKVVSEAKHYYSFYFHQNTEVFLFIFFRLVASLFIRQTQTENFCFPLNSHMINASEQKDETKLDSHCIVGSRTKRYTCKVSFFFQLLLTGIVVSFWRRHSL